MPLRHYSPGITSLADEIYRHENGELWSPIGYIDQPCYIMENIKTGERKTHVIDAPNSNAFTRLIPDQS